MQRITALSSDESDYHALLRSSVHALGNQSTVERLALRSEMRDSHALRQQRRQEACLLGKNWGQACWRTFLVATTSSRESVQCPRQVRICQTRSRNPSQADADRCFLCMNFHVGNVGSGRHRKLEST